MFGIPEEHIDNLVKTGYLDNAQYSLMEECGEEDLSKKHLFMVKIKLNLCSY